MGELDRGAGTEGESRALHVCHAGDAILDHGPVSGSISKRLSAVCRAGVATEPLPHLEPQSPPPLRHQPSLSHGGSTSQPITESLMAVGPYHGPQSPYSRFRPRPTAETAEHSRPEPGPAAVSAEHRRPEPGPVAESAEQPEQPGQPGPELLPSQGRQLGPAPMPLLEPHHHPLQQQQRLGWHGGGLDSDHHQQHLQQQHHQYRLRLQWQPQDHHQHHPLTGTAGPAAASPAQPILQYPWGPPANPHTTTTPARAAAAANAHGLRSAPLQSVSVHMPVPLCLPTTAAHAAMQAPQQMHPQRPEGTAPGKTHPLPLNHFLAPHGSARMPSALPPLSPSPGCCLRSPSPAAYHSPTPLTLLYPPSGSGASSGPGPGPVCESLTQDPMTYSGRARVVLHGGGLHGPLHTEPLPALPGLRPSLEGREAPAQEGGSSHGRPAQLPPRPLTLPLEREVSQLLQGSQGTPGPEHARTLHGECAACEADPVPRTSGAAGQLHSHMQVHKRKRAHTCTCTPLTHPHLIHAPTHSQCLCLRATMRLCLDSYKQSFH